MLLNEFIDLLKKRVGSYGIEDTADFLSRFLHAQSEKFNAFIHLQGRITAHRQNIDNGNVSYDNLTLERNDLQLSLLNFISSLAKEDLHLDKIAIPDASAPKVLKKKKRGKLLYHIPTKMKKQVTYPCKIRIALSEDILFEDWERQKDDVQRDNIRISKKMQIELLNKDASMPFEITTPNSKEQHIFDDDYTDWHFDVKPLRCGTFPLSIKVSTMVKEDDKWTPREVILNEQVDVTTTAAEKSVEQLRPSTQEFSYTSSAVYSASAPEERFKPIGRGHIGMRAVAIFMALLVFLPGVTWAFAPDIQQDYWKARWDNNPEAYTEFIQEYEQKQEVADNPLLEKARFRKVKVLVDDVQKGEAVLPEAVEAIRAYEAKHLGTKAVHEVQVVEKLKQLEVEQMRVVQEQPDVPTITEFLELFPDSERLPEVKQIVEKESQDKAILLPKIEAAFVKGIKTKPEAARVQAFLETFPETEMLSEVVQSVKQQKPAELPKVEQVILQSIRQKPTETKVKTYLNSFSENADVKAVEKAVEQDKKLQKAVQHDLEQAKTAQQNPSISTATPVEKQENIQTEQQEPSTEPEVIQPSVTRIKEQESPIKATTPPLNEPSTEPEVIQPPVTRIKEKESRKTTTPASSLSEDPPPIQKEEKTEVKEATKAATSSPTSTITPPSEPTTDQRTGLEMVSVKGGSFKMGSTENSDEQPIHDVSVSTFQIGKYEVTQQLWQDIMGENPSEFNDCPQCPVEYVSWDDIQSFLNKLNTKYPGKNYRLPTEAEWEYAARGGSKSQGYKYAGSNTIGDVAWYDDNSGSKTHPVGTTKKANELELYDMSGNVWEWCQDVWHDDYAGAPNDGSAWMSGGDQERRVLRGGSWNIDDGCRSTLRFNLLTDYDYRDFDSGFRLARH